MAKYLYLFSGGASATTPGALEQSAAAWTAWFAKLGNAVVDSGAPTMPGKSFHKAAPKSGAGKLDPESMPPVRYSIIRAADMKAATNIALDSPEVEEGGSASVYEIAPE
jgi:hypothetical protein